MENIAYCAGASIFQLMRRFSVFGTKSAILAFGAMLKHEFEKAGLTAADVCRATNLYKGHLSGILLGKRSLDTFTALKLAETLPPEACRRVLMSYAREIAFTPLLKYFDIVPLAPVPSVALVGPSVAVKSMRSSVKRKTAPHRRYQKSDLSLRLADNILTVDRKKNGA